MVPGPVEVFEARGRLCATNQKLLVSETKELALEISTPTTAAGAWGGRGAKSVTFRWAFE